MLFDSFEAYDVQETRRISKEEGRTVGELCKLIEIVCKKVQKNCSVQEIADMLEEDEIVIQEIYDVVVECALEFDVEKIYQKLRLKSNNKAIS